MEREEIEENLKQKYHDAALLHENHCYANAIYLCGYCAELALKYAITKQLNWSAFRTAGRMSCLKSHELDFLLQLTGQEAAIKSTEDWQIVNKWKETDRYNDPRSVCDVDSQNMLEATRKIVRQLCAISL